MSFKIEAGSKVGRGPSRSSAASGEHQTEPAGEKRHPAERGDCTEPARAG